jgi:hypothetical protein
VGPTCEVRLATAPAGESLESVDAFLSGATDRVGRTRNGRVWSVWIGGRPYRVAALPGVIELSAGCNDSADYEVLRRLGDGLAQLLGGEASEPVK